MKFTGSFSREHEDPSIFDEVIYIYLVVKSLKFWTVIQVLRKKKFSGVEITLSLSQITVRAL